MPGLYIIVHPFCLLMLFIPILIEMDVPVHHLDIPQVVDNHVRIYYSITITERNRVDLQVLVVIHFLKVGIEEEAEGIISS